MAATVRRWGVHTLGALAALPGPDVHARLGERGVSWQRWAAGEDEGVLVPWVAEPVFDAAMDLEWPIEGLEPLSFVLARIFEPLAVRLEQADRGAVCLHTALHLTTRAVHLRTIPLPAPMRDPKTLRTLVLLDLESHPLSAAVDRVHVVLDPTPARVLQWTLFERAQPAPEQVATLLARLTALMGEGHVGAPEVVDSWKPGAFRIVAFGERDSSPPAACSTPPAHTAVSTPPAHPAPGTRHSAPGTLHPHSAPGTPHSAAGTLHSHSAPGTPHLHPAPSTQHSALPLAFRRFRLPIPVRVRVEDGRPVRVTTDRHGVTGGAVVEAAGPWRVSGGWWTTDVGRESTSSLYESGSTHGLAHVSTQLPRPDAWDRDEWEIAMADGTVYRLSVERSVGQWFLEGMVD
jgi:hypothetical protein